MADDFGPHYDSFVIRLWYAKTPDQLLRAEIAHVQTEAVYVGRGVSSEWIGDTVKKAVAEKAGRIGETGSTVDEETP